MPPIIGRISGAVVAADTLIAPAQILSENERFILTRAGDKRVWLPLHPTCAPMSLDDIGKGPEMMVLTGALPALPRYRLSFALPVVGERVRLVGYTAHDEQKVILDMTIEGLRPVPLFTAVLSSSRRDAPMLLLSERSEHRILLKGAVILNSAGRLVALLAATRPELVDGQEYWVAFPVATALGRCRPLLERLISR